MATVEALFQYLQINIPVNKVYLDNSFTVLLTDDGRYVFKHVTDVKTTQSLRNILFKRNERLFWSVWYENSDGMLAIKVTWPGEYQVTVETLLVWDIIGEIDFLKNHID